MRFALAIVAAAALCAGCKGEQVAPYDGGTGTDSDTDTDADTDSDSDPAEACHPSAVDWPAEWADLEDQMVDLVNGVRATGTECGDAGVFEATGPLVMEPHLRCAARVHSLDMGERNYFSHDSPDGPLGENEYERVMNAGYGGFALGENIAAGYSTAEGAFDRWMSSSGHCVKLMNPAATETGVGFAAVDGSDWTNYWTENFGTP